MTWLCLPRPKSGGLGMSIGRLSAKVAPLRIEPAASTTVAGVSRLIVPSSSSSPNTPHAAPCGAPSRIGNWSWVGRRGSGARGRGVGAGREVAARRTDALGAIFDLGFALDLSGAFQRTAGFDLATTRFALAWALGVGFALVRSFAGNALAPVFGL